MHTVGLEGADRDAEMSDRDSAPGDAERSTDGEHADAAVDDAGQLDCGSNGCSGSDAFSPVDATAPDAADMDAFVFDSGDSGCPPQDRPSTQHVSVNVLNEGPNAIYIVSAGSSCEPFSVQQQSGRPIGLALGWACPCQCPGPVRTTGATMYYRLDPGQTYALSWDAREEQWCYADHPGECGPQGDGMDLVGALQPVPGGLGYRIMLAYEHDLPASCGQVVPMGNSYPCPAMGPVGYLPNGSTIEDRCVSSQTATISVPLPTSGDVMINAIIP
jgi:hypothetical protein